MYVTRGEGRALEMLIQGKIGFGRYKNGWAQHEDCNNFHFHFPCRKYQLCVYEKVRINRADGLQYSVVKQSEGKELIIYGSFSGGKSNGYNHMSSHFLPKKELTLNAKECCSRDLGRLTVIKKDQRKLAPSGGGGCQGCHICPLSALEFASASLHYAPHCPGHNPL